MAENRNDTPKARKFTRDGRRTARRRRGLPEFQNPEAEEHKWAEGWSSGEMFIMEKVHEFFQECGGDERGFITREDMKKLQEKFPFSSEELETVFDKLDNDNKGILTPEQLTTGLSHFLSDQSQPLGGDDPKEPSVSLYQSPSLQHQMDSEDEEKQQFAALLEKLGAGAIFEGKTEIWKLWSQLRVSEPNLLGHLEDFLSKVTGQIQDTLHEKEELEQTLKKCTVGSILTGCIMAWDVNANAQGEHFRKMGEHNADVQRLYEEMELQINSEKERIETESMLKFQAQSQDVQKELDSKQDEVQQLLQMQTQLQAEIESLRGQQEETSAENQQLKVTNQEMETRLEGIQQELQEAQDRLVTLQEEAAHQEEKEGEWNQSPSGEEVRLGEAVQQLQAEIESLRGQQEETSAENEQLKVLNWEMESRLEGIQRELEEARDRHREWDQSLHSEKDTRPRNLQSEDLQPCREILVHESRIISIEEEPLPQQEPGTQDLEVAEQGNSVMAADAVFVEVAGPPWRDGAADVIAELQVEIESLRGQQEETSAENQQLKVTNQEMETRLEGIQRELQEAQDWLVTLQEEAAHREERERESGHPADGVGPRSDEAFQQLQAEIESLRGQQEETSAENQQLKVTNQEMETRLQGIQRELQEAQDRLVTLQEEAAHREERERESDHPADGVGPCSDEAFQQLQAEIESLHGQQEETSTENQQLKVTNQEMETRLEGIQQELQEAQDRLVTLQEEAAHREERERESDHPADGVGPCSDEAFQQLQAEIESLRGQQEETSAENQQLKVTNQEMETRLEGIQQELQEAQDRLVTLQEEAAHREERE
ncbi:EF-hand calcium-binding domain-containing protein 4B-like, partial [Mobula hypostoma]|uniref:EF-hand calcium-binding domain-containing protein 4B-like n=1 Tax=Mobula hypostoma TaxID=723540 RepID=UPI002FC2884F